MQKKVGTANFRIYIIFFCISIFIIGCSSEHFEYNINALYLYWNANNSIIDLSSNMNQNGFIYKNEWNDISYYTDSAPSPEITFERKWANCIGYSHFFISFILYKKQMNQYVADNYETVLMLSNKYIPAKWHYINWISVYGNIYEQSNMFIYSINSKEEQILKWKEKGYFYFETKAQWKNQ